MYSRSKYKSAKASNFVSSNPKTEYSRWNGSITENYNPNPVISINQNTNDNISITWTENTNTNLSDPEVWGSQFWFTLHNGASKYPISASPITANNMKGFILGIPTMLPCIACKVHATNHIDSHKKDLDTICKGRANLFKFFVDFHNAVNKRLNKPIVNLEDAYKMYDSSPDGSQPSSSDRNVIKGYKVKIDMK